MNARRSSTRKKGNDDEKVSLKERLDALKNLPRFFKMVWDSSPGLTLTNAVLRILRASLPLMILYVGKFIIDEVLVLSQQKGPHSMTYLWELVAVGFVLAIASDGLNRVISLLDSLMGDRFANRTSVKIMEHAATLDLDQFEDAEFYDKLERARQQTVGRTVLLAQVLSQLQDFITMGFLATGLIIFNPWLIILLFLAVIPAFLGEAHFNDKQYALYYGQTSERRELDYIRYLGASDESAREVKIFDLSTFLVARFKQLSEKFYQASRRLSIQRSFWGTIFAVLGSAGYYGAYIYIILRTVDGHLSIGDLTFMAGSFRQLSALLEGILTRFTYVSQGAIYLKDLFEFFEITPHIQPPATPRAFPKPIQQGFTFENVGFKYRNAEKWANRHLNFTLHAGEKLALVGENGAGKTTLVKLLARLYDPTEGRILLDGHDLREYDLTELRKQVGVIFQDFLRYQMTMAHNIAIGDIQDKEDRPRIIAAATQSLADQLAARLPHHYDQMLGKRFNNGVELSGGEWQKIALARAYMKDAQLLILDEPTAALDARAEYDVFLRFADLTKGKTSVLISHRFSTVRMADRILVLEKGTVDEIGSHEELLARNGTYAALFHLQAQGYR